MNQANAKAFSPGKLKNRVKAFTSKPANILLIFFLMILLLFAVYPLLAMLAEMFKVHRGTEKQMTGLAAGTLTWYHWEKLLSATKYAASNFWQPLKNSLYLALGSAVLGITYGGTVAWLVTRTNLKLKKFITSVFLFTYIMPAWTIALFWVNMFKNSALGAGSVGLMESLFGICMPEWFVYGIFPMIVVSGLHYGPFAYILIGGILRNMDATLEESATILKASRGKILRRITIPIVMPAILSTFLLIFASGFSSYTVPIFLGSGVKCFTLATKMRALINSGYTGQAYIIAFVMIVIGTLVLLVNQWYTGKRRSFTTVTGKSGQVSLINLKKANMPVAILLCVFLAFFAVVPLISFALESIMLAPGNYSPGNFTLDFWIGSGNSPYLDGAAAGILRNPELWRALGNQLLLSLCCALCAGTAGIMIGYACVRRRGTKLSRAVEALAFFPYLMPAMAFGTIYLAISTTGTFSFLYSSFAILVIAGATKYLPFASRGGINCMLQVSAEIEEAALIVGVPWWKRMIRILFPIQKSSILSGYLLPFINGMRELALFVLLITNSRYLLTSMLLSYNQLGYDQYGNAITLMIILIVLIINFTMNKLTGASLEKGVGGGAASTAGK